MRILIVEDETVIRFNLELLVEELGHTVLDSVDTIENAIDSLERESVDLVFLDINVNTELDGIDLAHHINLRHKIPFIYITSNSDPKTVERAKLTQPAAFLVKPFNIEDLFTAIEIGVSNFNNGRVKENSESKQKDYIIVKDQGFQRKVKMSEILYLSADHIYVTIHLTSKKRYLVRDSFTHFLETLPQNFLRVHKSYAVNLEHVAAVNSTTLIVVDQELPVGRKYKEELLQLFEEQ
jgi:DNA-binding LytR/AlgR family response regulator